MMNLAAVTPRLSMFGYSALLRLRPAVVASTLKRVFNVQRRCLRLHNGVQFYIDPASQFGFQLLSRGSYEPTMTRLLELCLRSGDTFIDAGANEGYFSMLAAYYMSSGRVYAIEPQARLQPILRRNISINHFDQCVRRMNVALSDSPGTATLSLKPMMYSGASGMFRTGVMPGLTEVVETTTIDEIVETEELSRIRLLKIDVEGAEHLVVKGAEQTLRERLVDILALEYHPGVGNDPDACSQTHARLLEHGYQLTEVGGQTIYHLPNCGSMIDSL